MDIPDNLLEGLDNLNLSMAMGVWPPDMDESTMRSYLAGNPGCKSMMVCTAAEKGYSDLLCELLDQEGGDPNCRSYEAITPLHYASSAQIVSLLIEKGANPALQHTEYRQTALMCHTSLGNCDCVERLLQDARVVDKIHVQMPGTRCTALHEAAHTFEDYAVGSQARILEMLLLHGSNPYLRCNPRGLDSLVPLDPGVIRAGERTALELLRKYCPNDHAAMAVLEAAIVEPKRTYLLYKARHLSDAIDAITNAQGTTPEERKQKLLAKTPLYLKERVEEDKPLPLIELTDGHSQDQHGKYQAGETKEGEKKREPLLAVLRYVVGDQGEEGSAKMK